MMQSERNQQTVEEGIDSDANCPQSDNARAQRYQNAIDDRPYEEQDCRRQNGKNCGHNRYTPLP